MSLLSVKDCDLVVHDAELIDGCGLSLGKNYYSTTHHSNDFFMNLLYPRYLGCCMAFKKRILRDCLPFPNSRRGHDYWIGCFAALHYKVNFIPYVLLSYRRHNNNVTSSSQKSHRSILVKLFKRIDIVYFLIGRTFKWV